MFYDLENEGYEKESHHKFNEECLTHELSTIVAAISWAQLGEVVTASRWKMSIFLWAKWEAHKANGASEHASKNLRNNN